MAETIGQQLKHLREERHLSIEQVAESTRIRTHYIQAIEEDDFESLPSPVQARAFLRLYAGFLGCSLDDLIARQAGTEIATPVIPAPATVSASLPKEPEPTTPETLPEVTTPSRPLSALLGTVTERAKAFIGRFRRTAAPVEPETPAPVEPVIEEPPTSLPGPAPEPISGSAEGKSSAASQAIFKSIGQTLRQRREMLSLTLEEVERNIHVRTHYLEALERGDFEHLPSSVQGRGMLNNYASFLDLDSDGMLMQYAEGLQTLRVERQPQPVEMQPQKDRKRRFSLALPPALRRYLSMDMLVGGGLIVLLLAFAIWGTSRIIGLRSGATPEPTAPSISDILGSTPAGSAETPTPDASGLGQPQPPATVDTSGISIPASGAGNVHVVMVALQSAWAQVVVDGKTQFQGRVTSGTAYPFDGEKQIEVLTGNGAAISIIYNESDLGAMGSLGEVVDHIYTADSILNPTPTFTPTPTITPKPSVTPRPSPTVRPSPTPKK